MSRVIRHLFGGGTRAATAASKGSAELVAHKPHCSNRNLLQLFALVLCAPLPTRRKLRFHLCNSCISSLVFVVREPCVRSTRLRGILLRAPRRRSGTAFSRFVLSRACLPFVACNELAIATKSIASVLPHAERTPWVPSNKVQRGERRYGRDALNNPSGGRIVAKANEADCVAQTPKSKHVRKGEFLFLVHDGCLYR